VDDWRGYITWLYRVSHLVMTPPVEVVEVPPPRRHNKEVIIEEEYARDRLNPLQIIWNVYDITEETLHDGEPQEFYHSIFRRMQDEMHPIIELQIARRRRG